MGMVGILVWREWNSRYMGNGSVVCLSGVPGGSRLLLGRWEYGFSVGTLCCLDQVSRH